ncbi:MAG TPA: BTAD domain-containing putative transcriptional regulator, partial [Candidatus Limnocylindrales bacterium]
MEGRAIRVLGPIEADVDGAPVDLGGPKSRAVLALLVLEANRAISTDHLIEQLWGDEPPASAEATLQSYVSRLRRALGADVIESTGGGYRLRLDPERLDIARAEGLATMGREALAAGDATGAARQLGEALALWRGVPLGDLATEAWALPEVERLSNLRAGITEDRIDAELELGRHAALVGELEALVDRSPLRERLRGQLMLALYRSGRQADALAAYHEARRTLDDELGLEPGRALQALEGAILRQDPALDPAPPAAAEAESGGSTLVGRETELEWLRVAVEAAFRPGRQPRGAVASVTGEPGIGKTRIAEEAGELAARLGADVAWGRCWEAGGAPPYWPWTQALRHRLAQLDQAALEARFGDRLPGLVGAVPWLFDPAQVPDVEARSAEARFVVFSAAATVVQALARERPLLLVLDDLHAADEPSLLLLRFLAGEIASSPVLILALARSGEGPDAVRALLAEVAGRAQPRIDLTGLPAPAVAALVERETGRTPSDELLASIRADTGGNPLFVGEVARAIRTGDDAIAEPGRPRLSSGVRELIARRVGGLSADCREALVRASVIGRE